MTERPRTVPRRLGGARTVSTTAATTPPQVPPPAPQRAPGRRRYDQLERKETRLREDQADALARLAKTLSRRARRSRHRDADPERITDNTLIRVAVDLLLARAGDLEGTTEDEIRASVGLPTRGQ